MWTTYRTPIDIDYDITLTPAGCPAKNPCPATMKTAPAHEPINPITPLKAIRDLFSVDEFEVGGSVGGDPPVGNDPPTSDPLVKVWAQVEFTGSGWDYRYYGRTFTATSVAIDWSMYPGRNTSHVYDSLSEVLIPGSPMLLKSFHSTIDPYEVNGTVSFNLGGQEHIFFAPSIVRIPEPATLSLLVIGMVFFTARRKEPTARPSPARTCISSITSAPMALGSSAA